MEIRRLRAALLMGIALFGVACTSAEVASVTSQESAVTNASETVNVNTASRDELMRVPFIGEKLAIEIVSHRELYGHFRRSEQLLLLDGVSDRRFREIRHLIRVDQ